MDIRREGWADPLATADEHDDAPGSNARIDIELAPGRYQIRVWLYYPGSEGVAEVSAERL